MRVVSVASSLLLLIGCAIHPVPAQHLRRSEATVQAARAIGAADDPEANVHLQLAERQLDEARDLILEGDGEAADWMLARAYTDAELAQALALENFTRVEAARAVEQVEGLRAPRARTAAAVPERPRRP
jgi:hypothetical protein